MAITAKQVNELRQITGAGMMDCKTALTEADGDIEKAIDILRKKGQKVAAKRADREAAEGNVYVYTSADASWGIAFSLNCETEPVSNTKEFKDLGQSILDAAVAQQATDVTALLQTEVNGTALQEQIIGLSGKIGEKIEVSSYALLKGERIVSYLHGKSIAVLVNMSNVGGADVEEAGKDVAMQIAAMRPVAVDAAGVPADLVAREKEIGIERARQEGKPEHILDKIAEGFVKKFYQENTLLNQAFVKENKLTVQQFLDTVKKGLTVKEFARIAIGGR
jgi:elongation factor Ts